MLLALLLSVVVSGQVHCPRPKSRIWITLLPLGIPCASNMCSSKAERTVIVCLFAPWTDKRNEALAPHVYCHCIPHLDLILRKSRRRRFCKNPPASTSNQPEAISCSFFLQDVFSFVKLICEIQQGQGLCFQSLLADFANTLEIIRVILG